MQLFVVCDEVGAAHVHACSQLDGARSVEGPLFGAHSSEEGSEGDNEDHFQPLQLVVLQEPAGVQPRAMVGHIAREDEAEQFPAFQFWAPRLHWSALGGPVGQNHSHSVPEEVLVHSTGKERVQASEQVQLWS